LGAVFVTNLVRTLLGEDPVWDYRIGKESVSFKEYGDKVCCDEKGTLSVKEK
jgi:hypothetical protein